MENFNFMLWVNYLSEHPTYVNLTDHIIIDVDYLQSTLRPYNIRKDILLQRKFYNFHSYIPHNIKIYNDKCIGYDWQLDYARLNYLSKMNWQTRHKNVVKNYQIISTEEKQHLENQDLKDQDLENQDLKDQDLKDHDVENEHVELRDKILLAHAGKLVLEGPVLGLWHVAQYGLSVDKNIVILLLHTAAQLKEIILQENLYIVILLKMGYSIFLITELIPQQMWATILTGVLTTWPELNLAYGKEITHDFTSLLTARYGFFRSIESYYENLLQRGLFSKNSFINKFNIPEYSNPQPYSSTKTIICRYEHSIDIIRERLWNMYPRLSDQEVMQKWLIDKHSGMLHPTLANLTYINFTISTAELAAKFDIANIYTRDLLLDLILLLNTKSNIYYRKSSYQLGDKKVMSTDSIERIINRADAEKILNGDRKAELINFITLVHALNMLAQTNQRIFSTVPIYLVADDDA